MTISNAYAPRVFAAASGRQEFVVDFPTAANEDFDVYKVLNGVYTLLTLNYHYYVEIQEADEDANLRRNARIDLVAPLAAGAHLEVFRTTGITNTFTAVALQPFAAEDFEHALDKICMIQQEQEGHLCDCRTETEPEYQGTPEVPEE